MRFRIMMHYVLSFFLACFFIVVINIFYMRSYVYKEGELYHFDPEPMMTRIGLGITSSDGSSIQITPALKSYLEIESIGVQIVDETLKDIIRFNVPVELPESYTPSELVALYEREDVTTFVETISYGDRNFTVLAYLNPEIISRTLYTYDVAHVGAAYNILWLVGMNAILLMIISYMYTYSITRPIHRVIQRIVSISKGTYDSHDPGKGIYAPVEKAMNHLGEQLRDSQLEREQADATREEWISNLSHDIKTPLTSIMGYGELLGEIDYPLSDSERLHYKEVILSKGAYIEKLLADLNLSIRLKHHQMTLDYQVVNLVDLVKTILIDVLNSPQIVLSEHSMEFTHSHDEIPVEMDFHLFKRAFLNLVHNSFIHNSGAVLVKVNLNASDSEWVTIDIEDNGVGVQEKDLERIFSRYYRGTHTRTTSEGSGLGMAIAKDIIEAHHGMINAEKSTLGGLKITIKLRYKI